MKRRQSILKKVRMRLKVRGHLIKLNILYIEDKSSNKVNTHTNHYSIIIAYNKLKNTFYIYSISL